jgi:hypothetical protein
MLYASQVRNQKLLSSALCSRLALWRVRRLKHREHKDHREKFSQTAKSLISLFTLDITDYKGKIGAALNALYLQWGFTESLHLNKR